MIHTGNRYGKWLWQHLYYDQIHNGSTPQYGGNISSMSWKGTESASTQPSYNFYYDRLSRLTSAQYYMNGNYSGRFDTSYEYDIMGNITSLQRSGKQSNGTSYGVIDDLTLSYSGNQLVSVSDAATDEPTAMGAQHFHDGASTGAEYTYDANGNMTKDVNSEIVSITYDINNQPDSVHFSNEEAVRYYYDAHGNRLGSDEYTLSRIVRSSRSSLNAGGIIGLIPRRVRNERRFCDNIIYDGSTISQILFDGGYITFDEETNEPLYHFYITDHQGNNRVVVDANGNVEERNHYYPYGALMSSSTTSIQRYKYNGKELNQHSYMQWYDYMARQTMPILGRFSSVDPMAEKYYGMSPYLYCAGNPVRFVDKDGREIVISGTLTDMAVQQIQNKVGNGILLSLTSDNFLCYAIVNKKDLSRHAKRMIKMIDDNSIVVHMTTTNKNVTSTGNLLVGGAFMGNDVESDSNGTVVRTTAFQEVNPIVLGKADTYVSKGTSVMHEITEAYEGAKISAKKRISSPNAGESNSVYPKAHKNATSQPIVYRRMFDKYGNINSGREGIVKAEWYVKRNADSNDETIIQTIP